MIFPLVILGSVFVVGTLATPEEVGAAPYPPSGWRPAGKQFFLPPRSTYYAPPQKYGPPPAITTEASVTITTEAEATTTDAPTTTGSPQDGDETARQREDTEENEEATYYVLLPDGRLQRVSYKNGPAPKQVSLLPQRAAPSNGYIARFLYQDVEPVGPVYSFSGPQIVRIAREIV